MALPDNKNYKDPVSEDQKNKLEKNTVKTPDPEDVENNSSLSEDFTDDLDNQLKGFDEIGGDDDTCPQDTQNWGQESTIYSYIFKGQLTEEEFEATGDPCEPWIHSTAKFDSIMVLDDLRGRGGNGAFSIMSDAVTFSGSVEASTITGDVSGDITGDVTGNVTGDVTGNVSGTAGGLTASADISTDTTDDPTNNKEIVFNYVNDTTLRIKMKGADGTVRSVDLTLA